MLETVLVLGANSEIAQALCHKLGRRGCQLVLAGRNRRELDSIAADLRIRYGIVVHVELFEATAFSWHEEFVERCIQRFEDGLTGVIACYGTLPDQRETETNFASAHAAIDINFTSVVSVLNRVANYLERRGRGYIAAVSSVAGDRGRQSNYLYGAAKAALTVYLQGLRNRLFHAGVHVVTIKPGFVYTRMTRDFLDPGSLLVASPAAIARDIDRAIRRRNNTIYSPSYWRGIMLLIRFLPESIFKRLKL